MALLAKARLNLPGDRKDKADVAFALTGEGVRVQKADVVSAIVLMRGDGLVGYDGALDLVVNAGMLEKVQSRLGQLGELIGALSDRVVAYTVKGTVSKPKIGIRALGISG